MAERGVTIAVRSSDGRAQPRELAQRAHGVRNTHRLRWVQADTPLKKWAVAFDYARAAAAAAGRGGLDPSGEIDRATGLLWSLGDMFTSRLIDAGNTDE